MKRKTFLLSMVSCLTVTTTMAIAFLSTNLRNTLLAQGSYEPYSLNLNRSINSSELSAGQASFATSNGNPIAFKFDSTKASASEGLIELQTGGDFYNHTPITGIVKIEATLSGGSALLSYGDDKDLLNYGSETLNTAGAKDVPFILELPTSSDYFKLDSVDGPLTIVDLKITYSCVKTEKYTVSFDSDGGSTVPSQTVESGKLASEPAIPTKANSTFLGWMIANQSSEYKDYDFATPVTSDITLKAHWYTAHADNIIIHEDFSSGAGLFAGKVELGDGAAKWTATGGNYYIFNERGISPIESNNYEFSFDMKYIGTPGTVYFEMVGLNAGQANPNIWLEILNDGGGANAPYWRFNSAPGANVYNNSLLDDGGLEWTVINMSDFVNVKVIHYEGYLELWVNGIRRIVTHLMNFGNNAYGGQNRKAYQEGNITGFGLNCGAPGTVVIDNFVIKEAFELVPHAVYNNSNPSYTGENVLPLSAQNLANENYAITGTFKVLGNAGEYYPTIALMGLNGGTLDAGEFYGINFQIRMLNGKMLPQLYCVKTGDGIGYAEGTEKPFQVGDTIAYKIIISGDRITTYLNGELAYRQTFTGLGIPKGHLQYIRIRGGNGGSAWESLTYKGYGNLLVAED